MVDTKNTPELTESTYYPLFSYTAALIKDALPPEDYHALFFNMLAHFLQEGDEPVPMSKAAEAFYNAIIRDSDKHAVDYVKTKRKRQRNALKAREAKDSLNDSPNDKSVIKAKKIKKKDKNIKIKEKDTEEGKGVLLSSDNGAPANERMKLIETVMSHESKIDRTISHADAKALLNELPGSITNMDISMVLGLFPDDSVFDLLNPQQFSSYRERC